MRTAVGYAGGESPAPTYHDLERHTEVVEVEFDPAVLSYEALLAMFWDGHDPRRPGRGTQYRALLLCSDDTQLVRARRSAAELEARTGRPVATPILTGKPFHRAEDYHQKWKLRQRKAWWSDLARHYDTETALLDSRAAAALNGYAGGHGTREQWARDGEKLGLSRASRTELASRFKTRRAG